MKYPDVMEAAEFKMSVKNLATSLPVPIQNWQNHPSKSKSSDPDSREGTILTGCCLPHHSEQSMAAKISHYDDNSETTKADKQQLPLDYAG